MQEKPPQPIWQAELLRWWLKKRKIKTEFEDTIVKIQRGTMRTLFQPFTLTISTIAVLAISPSTSFAQGTQFTGNPITDGILSTIVYGAIGMIMAFISYKVVDLLTPGDLGKDIADNNIALAILSGLTILGICIIIAAAIAG